MKFSRYGLWFLLPPYIALVYATIPFAAQWRKRLVEGFGYDIWDWLYLPVVLAIGYFLWSVLRMPRNRRWIALLGWLAISFVYLKYLASFHNDAERLHFLQYGFMGVLFNLAFRRHLEGVKAFVLGLAATYLTGLGDEFVQHLMPGRVGEFKDAWTNLVSGFLGTVSIPLWRAPDRKVITSGSHWPAPLFLCACVVCTALFFQYVHGFGYRHTFYPSGVIYSSLNENELRRINRGEDLSPVKMRDYDNEAERHLLQREYYCANEFMDEEGEFYRRWDKCAAENQILESYYSRYVRENAGHPVSPAIRYIDKDVAVWSEGLLVGWDEEKKGYMQWAVPEPGHYESRVKSTLLVRITALQVWLSGIVILLLNLWYLVRQAGFRRIRKS